MTTNQELEIQQDRLKQPTVQRGVEIDTMQQILVASAEVSILSSLKRDLEQAGYYVISTTGGDDAVRLCTSSAPDLAVLDVHLADVNGLEAARQIRERTNVPFMFLSSQVDSESVDSAIKHGALGYLVSPIETPQVLAGIAAALARAQDLKDLQNAESKSQTALKEGREISMVVGLLMERHHLNQESAFEILRTRARSEQRRISDLANEMARAFCTLTMPVEHVKRQRNKRPSTQD